VLLESNAITFLHLFLFQFPQCGDPLVRPCCCDCSAGGPQITIVHSHQEFGRHRHSVASFIVDAGYSIEVAQQQLRHSNARTTLGYTHFRGGATEQAMAEVSASLKLDAVGRTGNKGSQYIQ